MGNPVYITAVIPFDETKKPQETVQDAWVKDTDPWPCEPDPLGLTVAIGSYEDLDHESIECFRDFSDCGGGGVIIDMTKLPKGARYIRVRGG